VSEVIVNGTWELHAALHNYGVIQDRLNAVVISTGQLPDVLVLPHALDGILSSKLAFSFLRPRTPLLPWAEHIWSPSIPPSHSRIYWRLHHDTILSCRPAICSSQVSDIYLAAILYTLHTILWARNSLRFSTVQRTLHSTKVCIHSFIAMSGNV